MRGKAHSDEVRAEIASALLAGLGITEVAEKYNLPKSTVSRIRDEISAEKLEQVGTEKRARIDELLLDCLAANLQAQKKIAETVSEPHYIRKQSASAVADLYETLADKAIRLLEAASAAGIGGGDTPDEAEDIP